MRHKYFALLAGLLLAALALAGCAAKPDRTQSAEAVPAGLTIDIASLSQEPTFVDWTEDGTAMQVIALVDAGGAPRLAFNTCQSCGGSPYAWFEYIGDDTLQCQNCGLTFATGTVGTARATGCNPVTIANFVVDGDTITVPQTVLAAAAPGFRNWKVFD